MAAAPNHQTPQQAESTPSWHHTPTLNSTYLIHMPTIWSPCPLSFLLGNKFIIIVIVPFTLHHSKTFLFPHTTLSNVHIFLPPPRPPFFHASSSITLILDRAAKVQFKLWHTSLNQFEPLSSNWTTVWFSCGSKKFGSGFGTLQKSPKPHSNQTRLPNHQTNNIVHND